MQIRHSILQEDYLRWKFEVLSEIAPERTPGSKTGRVQQKPENWFDEQCHESTYGDSSSCL